MHVMNPTSHLALEMICIPAHQKIMSSSRQLPRTSHEMDDLLNMHAALVQKLARLLAPSSLKQQKGQVASSHSLKQQPKPCGWHDDGERNWDAAAVLPAEAVFPVGS
jgi:hypothetical protein